MKEVNSANEANMKYEDVQKQNQELEDRIREDES